jgi:NitT/TauT family transport system permease protein
MSKDNAIAPADIDGDEDQKPRGRSVGVAVTPALFMIGVIGVWELLVRKLEVPVYLLPAPSEIAIKMIVQRDVFFVQIWPTSSAIISGFLLAVAVGVPAATLMVYSATIRRTIYPILLTAQVLPKVALAPLFIVWFGFGFLPKVLMTFLISFFPIIIDTLTGLNSVRPESLMLIRSMGGNRWQSFWKVRMPSALPSMFGGLKVAITFAVVGTVVAEFVGSDNGLGYLLVLARGNLDTVTVFAAIVWLIIIGFAFYFAVEVAERLLIKGRSGRRRNDMGAGL